MSAAAPKPRYNRNAAIPTAGITALVASSSTLDLLGDTAEKTAELMSRCPWFSHGPFDYV